MINFIIPIHHHSCHNHNGDGLASLIAVLIALYITYAGMLCAGRYLKFYTRKKFILYLFIPFLEWFIWFFKLFKKD